MENLKLDELKIIVEFIPTYSIITIASLSKLLYDKISTIYYDLFKPLLQALYKKDVSFTSNLDIIRYYKQQQQHIPSICTCFLLAYRRHKESIPSRKLVIKKPLENKYSPDESPLFLKALRFKNFRCVKDLCLKIPSDKLETYLSKIYYETAKGLRPTTDALAHNLFTTIDHLSVDDKLDFIFLQLIYIMHTHVSLSIYKRNVVNCLSLSGPN
jgi:hypothetical protein